MTINEKVSYIKGMLEGMELGSKESKLISSMLEVLEEIGLAIEDIDASFDAVDEELNAINDELDEIEEILEEEEEYDDDDEDEDEEDFWDDVEDDFAECDCPNCGEYLFIDRSAIEAGAITCPNCDVKFAIELNDECGHGDCDCGCCDHDHEEE